MCHQAGFENTVAVSGTALTDRHLPILKRYTDNLLLSFDMDSAGDNATKRSIGLAESQGFNLKVVNVYDNAKDPAEIILENPVNWEASVKGARGIMDYYFDTAFLHFDRNTVEGRLGIQNIILPAIKRLPNKIEQSLWIGKLAPKLGVKEDAILAELANIKLDNSQQFQPTVALATTKNSICGFTQEGRIKMLEERIVSLILKNPYSLNLIKDDDVELFSGSIRSFLEKSKKAADPIFAIDDESQTEEKLKAVLADISKGTEHKDFFDTLALRAEVELENEGPEEAELCLLQLKDIKLRNVLEKLSLQIAAEQNQDKMEEFKKEFDSKARELHSRPAKKPTEIFKEVRKPESVTISETLKIASEPSAITYETQEFDDPEDSAENNDLWHQI
jgi:DNA primase